MNISQVLLHYPHCRVVLHGTCLADATLLRFAMHGTEGSFIKRGFDPQEDSLKAGGTSGNPLWGADLYPGTLTRMQMGSAEVGII